MQTPLGLTIMGLLIIAVTVGILIRGKANPIIPMTLVPAIGVFILGYGFEDLADFYESGLGCVMSVAVMFIFAVIFFGILQAIGLFRPVITSLVVATRRHILLVY